MLTYKQFIKEIFEKISDSKGSNPGGVYKDTDNNEKHYIKHPENPDQAKTEVLSAKLHELMGIHTLKPKLANIKPRKISVSTKFNNNLEPIKSKDIPKLTTEHHKQLGNIYAAGVLTKNWDALGSGIEYGEGNVAKDTKKGHLVSLDQGGSFNFRAQGGHKDYDGNIPEKDSLRDSGISEGAKFINHAMNNPEVKPHIIHTLKNMDMNKVHETFKSSGLHNWEDLHRNFIERHKKFLDHLTKD